MSIRPQTQARSGRYTAQGIDAKFADLKHMKNGNWTTPATMLSHGNPQESASQKGTAAHLCSLDFTVVTLGLGQLVIPHGTD
jgi:hypothetical protein